MMTLNFLHDFNFVYKIGQGFEQIKQTSFQKFIFELYQNDNTAFVSFIFHPDPANTGSCFLGVFCFCLGNKDFILGDNPCKADCAIFGLLSQMYYQSFEGENEMAIKGDLIFVYSVEVTPLTKLS